MADKAPKEDKDAQALAEALKKAADAIGKGSQEQVEQALQQLEEALQKNIEASNAEAQQSEAAEALAMALAKQGMDLAENMAASGLAVSDSWSMGGAADQIASGRSTSSDDASDSSESFDGSGSSPGNGTGDAGSIGQSGGSGLGGNGTGSSGGKGQGAGQGSGTGPGAGLGSGGRTLITAPRDLKGSGNVQQDGGPSTGGSVQKGGNSPIFDGVSRPYEEVYSDYATEAKRSLERSELPQSMQSLVENYFVEIDPGR
ncbi:hypothetical protein D3C78_891340 [compost metagenome]